MRKRNESHFLSSRLSLSCSAIATAEQNKFTMPTKTNPGKIRKSPTETGLDKAGSGEVDIPKTGNYNA